MDDLNNMDKYITLLSLIIASLSLLVAAVTLYIQRDHNKKELRPIISTIFQSETKGDNAIYSFLLVNDGHGVAIIKKIMWKFLDGTTIEITRENDFQSLITKMCDNLVSVTSFIPVSVKGNTSELLCSFEISNRREHPFSNILSGIVIAESIYGEVLIADEYGVEVKSNSLYSKLYSFFSKSN